MFNLPTFQDLRSRLNLRLRERVLKFLLAADSTDFDERVKRLVKHEMNIELGSFDTIRQLEVTSECSQYAEKRMAGAAIVADERSVLRYALEQVKLDGLYLEFGVWRGQTINLIAEYTNAIVHGFDSFQGLPEDWVLGCRKGTFDTQGCLPKVATNVQLHVGWFDEVLPSFVQQYPDPVAFLHVDCDLYSSTKTIFSLLGDRIKPGCVIVFDEYFNYPSWQEHEYKAFQEFVQLKRFKYRYLAYCKSGINAAVVME